MCARAMAVRLLVAAHRELGDVCAHVAVHQLEEHRAAALAAGLPGDGLDVGDVGDEVGLQHAVVVEARVAAEVLVVAEAVPEDVGIAHHEIHVVEDVVDQRRVGDPEELRLPVARAVEMLVGGVHRDGEQAALLPLEALPLAVALPQGGGATAGQHVDELVVDVLLRVEALPRGNRHHEGVIEVPGSFQVDVDAVAALAVPPLHGHVLEVLDEVAPDHVHALGLDPAVVGRVHHLGVAVHPFEVAPALDLHSVRPPGSSRAYMPLVSVAPASMALASMPLASVVWASWAFIPVSGVGEGAAAAGISGRSPSWALPRCRNSRDSSERMAVLFSGRNFS